MTPQLQKSSHSLCLLSSQLKTAINLQPSRCSSLSGISFISSSGKMVLRGSMKQTQAWSCFSPTLLSAHALPSVPPSPQPWVIFPAIVRDEENRDWKSPPGSAWRCSELMEGRKGWDFKGENFRLSPHQASGCSGVVKKGHINIP